MAPVKPKAPAKPTTKDRVGNDARVAKRPQRGFHKYKDGSLNMKPKNKAERDEFNENKESSPLLRLPPEIRDMIWKYVLGGKTFEAPGEDNGLPNRLRTAVLEPYPGNPKEGFALLRTCRQVYLETAPYPITLSTFGCQDPDILMAAIKKLKPYQRKQVRLICISLASWDYHDIMRAVGRWCPRFFRESPPAADNFELIIHTSRYGVSAEYVDTLRAYLNGAWKKQDGWTATLKITR